MMLSNAARKKASLNCSLTVKTKRTEKKLPTNLRSTPGCTSQRWSWCQYSPESKLNLLVCGQGCISQQWSGCRYPMSRERSPQFCGGSKHPLMSRPAYTNATHPSQNVTKTHGPLLTVVLSRITTEQDRMHRFEIRFHQPLPCFLRAHRDAPPEESQVRKA